MPSHLLADLRLCSTLELLFVVHDFPSEVVLDQMSLRIVVELNMHMSRQAGDEALPGSIISVSDAVDDEAEFAVTEMYQ